MPIHWAIDQNRHDTSARSMIVLTEWGSEWIRDRATMSPYSCKVYIPEPIVDVHQEENNSRLWRGSVVSNENCDATAHLEVPGNFLFPLEIRA